LFALVRKATNRPSALILGSSRASGFPFDGPVPVLLTLTQVVVEASRSRTKIWGLPLLQGAARFVVCDRKATNRPSPLTAGEVKSERLSASPSAPPLETLTRETVALFRS
jgi:hypothetical protein